MLLQSLKLSWYNQKTVKNDLEQHLRAIVDVSIPGGVVLLGLTYLNEPPVDE
jgi:hypothetical protein